MARAKDKESLNLIDTTPLAILKAIAKTAFCKFFYFNLLMGALSFPLQLLHFEIPNEETPTDMDSRFFVTEDLVEALVTPKQPDLPPAAPTGITVTVAD
ncbi:MAG: hypothetical protein ACXQTR_00160 [Candidatus Methanospirareceae archaeon]